LTVRGEGAADPYTIFSVGSAATISGLTVTNGRNTGAFASGGGISNSGNLTLDRVVVSGNSVRGTSGADGGGVYNGATAHMVIRDSTISGNVAEAVGAGPVFAEGGGVYFSADGGSLSISGSTISGNSVLADTGSCCLASAVGGAIHATDGTITNSTISGNRATANGGMPEAVGGVSATNFGTLTLQSVTVADNGSAFQVRTASSPTDAGGTNIGGSPRLQNVLIADPVGGPNCESGPGGEGGPTSQGGNFDEDGSCNLEEATDIGGADPLLGPLADNGGPTFTHALLPGSPAIDQGTSGGLTTDQRGSPRPVQIVEPIDAPPVEPPAMPTAVNPNGGDGADIGSFERQPAAAVTGPDPVPESGTPPSRKIHFSLRFRYVDKHGEAAVVARVFCHSVGCDLAGSGEIKVLPFPGRDGLTESRKFKLGESSGKFEYARGREVAGKLRFKVSASTAAAVQGALRAGARGRVRANLEVDGTNTAQPDATKKRFRNIKLFAHSRRDGASR
jgi:hypothetical protein